MSVILQAKSVRNSVERSGTGQKLPGLDVEKSGTGIDVEKSGTGIDVERSGTGRRLGQFVCLVLLLALAWPVAASEFSIGLTQDQGNIALVARGDQEVLVGSGPGQRGYYAIPIYSLSALSLMSEGSGSGTTSEGSGSGTTSEGSGSGTTSEGSGSGTTSEGSGSGTTSEGSGSGTTSEGSGSGEQSLDPEFGCLSEGSGIGNLSEGSGSGTSSHDGDDCVFQDFVKGSLWGYAEIVMTSSQSADVIFYREQDGNLVEHSVYGNVTF